MHQRGMRCIELKVPRVVRKRKLLLVIGPPGFIHSATGRMLRNEFDVFHAERFTIETLLTGAIPDLAIVLSLSVRDDPSLTISEIRRMRNILPVIAIGRESAPELSGCQLCVGMTLSEAKIHLLPLVHLFLTFINLRFCKRRIAVELGTVINEVSVDSHIALLRNSTDDYETALRFLATVGARESIILFGPRTHNAKLLRRMTSSTDALSSQQSSKLAVIDTNQSTFHMIQTLLMTIESISAKGFSARVFAHTPDNTFRQCPSRLHLAEQFLDSISGYIPAVVVCQYYRANLECVNSAIRTHPLIISKGKLMRNNFYYESKAQ